MPARVAIQSITLVIRSPFVRVLVGLLAINSIMGCGPANNPPNMVAGVTAPQYGMTYSGTPIGLPGPPHIPFGAPAGLQKHVMVNRTHVSLPDPVHKLKGTVRQQPGISYPTPPSRYHIKEQNINPGYPAGRPHFYDASRVVAPGQFAGDQGGAPGAYCPPGQGQVR